MLGVLLDLESFRYGLHPGCATQQLCDFGKSLNFSEPPSSHQQNGDVRVPHRREPLVGKLVKSE